MMAHPESVVMISKSNQDQTEGDIFEMGSRLASEVKQFVTGFCPLKSITKLSFIGHSLGGLIIRAAFPYLKDYKDKFYTFISMSTPHLGYMYNSSKLLDAGIWLLKNWRNSTCLSQL